MKVFNRDQQIVALLLALIILSAYFLRLFGQSYSRGGGDCNPGVPGPAGIFVEVGGLVKIPGIYAFDVVPTCVEAVARAGGLADGAVFKTCRSSPVLEGGKRIRLIENRAGGVDALVDDMDAAARFVLNIPLDVNGIDVEGFKLLPGVGTHLAEEIVRFRKRYGPFGSMNDLLRVSGIGNKKLNGMRPYLKIGPKSP